MELVPIDKEKKTRHKEIEDSIRCQGNICHCHNFLQSNSNQTQNYSSRSVWGANHMLPTLAIDSISMSYYYTLFNIEN